MAGHVATTDLSSGDERSVQPPTAGPADDTAATATKPLTDEELLEQLLNRGLEGLDPAVAVYIRDLRDAIDSMRARARALDMQLLRTKADLDAVRKLAVQAESDFRIQMQISRTACDKSDSLARENIRLREALGVAMENEHVYRNLVSDLSTRLGTSCEYSNDLTTMVEDLMSNAARDAQRLTQLELAKLRDIAEVAEGRGEPEPGVPIYGRRGAITLP